MSDDFAFLVDSIAETLLTGGYKERESKIFAAFLSMAKLETKIIIHTPYLHDDIVSRETWQPRSGEARATNQIRIGGQHVTPATEANHFRSHVFLSTGTSNNTRLVHSYGNDGCWLI